MRSSHNLVGIETTFDEDNLVPNAGLLAPAGLAQKLGVAELVDEHVRLPVDAAGRANCGTKAMTVIGAMLAAATRSMTPTSCGQALLTSCSTRSGHHRRSGPGYAGSSGPR